MFSKETLDKVKLAKQYIENKYQSIMTQEQKNQQNWSKILTLVDPGRDDLEKITKNIVDRQSINKRLQRQKDCLDNYKLYNVIGRGAFGEVRLARNIATNEVVAIKRLQKKYLLQKKQIYNAYLQRDFMIKNKSQFIVQMRSTFQDEDYLYIVMEYIQGGDLLHLLIEKDILTEDQTRFYMAELVLAIEEIHRMNYIHRDIKPDNILIDKNGHIKISDFGLSKYVETPTFEDKQKKSMVLTKMQKLKKLSHIKNKQKIYSKVGTPDYISPQVLTDKTYTHAVDLWGVGVIMFECLYGYPPFTDEDSKEVCHKVANWVDYLQFPNDIEVSTSAKMLMLGLMNHSHKRLNIKQIKSHPFFTDLKWQTIHKQKAPLIPKIKNDIDSSNFDSFEITNPWTKIEKQLILNFIRPKSKANSEKERKGNVTEMDQQTADFLQPNYQQDGHSQQECRQTEEYQVMGRNTVGPKFRFAGFDYRRLDVDPLEITAQDLVRKSYSHKPLKKILNNFSKVSGLKRLKTEQPSSKVLKSNRISIKNNKPSKKQKVDKKRPSQLISTNNASIIHGRYSTSKEVLKNTLDENLSRIKNSTNMSPRVKKQGGQSSKAQKIKQIYNSLTQKMKKYEDQNYHLKTHA